MGIKDTRFGVKHQKLLVEWKPINYKDMFTETPIYIRYVVITIVIFHQSLSLNE